MLVLVLFCFVTGTLAAQFPSGFPRCENIYKLNDQESFKQCIIDAADKARPFMAAGLKEIGVPSFKEIVVPSIQVEQKTRAIDFVATLTNVTVIGLENYNLTDALLDPTTDWHLKFVVELPKVDLNGTYHVKGRFLDQQVEQTGIFTALLGETSMNIDVHISTYERKGVEYGKIKSLVVDPKFNKAVGKFNNLFGENVVLNKALNSFLEDSTSYLLESVKPDLQTLIDSLVQTVGKGVTSRLPWKEIFYQNNKP